MDRKAHRHSNSCYVTAVIASDLQLQILSAGISNQMIADKYTKSIFMGR